MPLRDVIKIPQQDAISLFMPAYLPKLQQLGLKIVSLFPNNTKVNLPVISGLVVLFDDETGQPKALLDGAALTSMRTGAVSGLATALLARTDAQSVAIIGSGVQAKTQLEAVCCVRDIKKVWVYSPNRKNAQKFAEELSLKNGIPEIEITNLVHEATKIAVSFALPHLPRCLLLITEMSNLALILMLLVLIQRRCANWVKN